MLILCCKIQPKNLGISSFYIFSLALKLYFYKILSFPICQIDILQSIYYQILHLVIDILGNNYMLTDKFISYYQFNMRVIFSFLEMYAIF